MLYPSSQLVSLLSLPVLAEKERRDCPCFPALPAYQTVISVSLLWDFVIQ